MWLYRTLIQVYFKIISIACLLYEIIFALIFDLYNLLRITHANICCDQVFTRGYIFHKLAVISSNEHHLTWEYILWHDFDENANVLWKY